MDKFATIRINHSPDTALEKLKETLDVDSMEPIQETIVIQDSCESVEDNGSSMIDVSNEPQEDGINNIEVNENEVVCRDSSHRAFVADALTHFKEIEADDPRQISTNKFWFDYSKMASFIPPCICICSYT